MTSATEPPPPSQDQAQLLPDPVVLRLGPPKLSSSASGSFAWTSASRFSQQAAQFLAAIALARLLLPADYGLYAVVGSVTLFASLFTDLGLGAAVVHTPVPTRSYLATAFWINAVTGWLLSAAAVGAGYLLAWIYGEPQLRHLMWVSGLMFGLDLTVVHTALLERTMTFKPLALIETATAVIGLAVSILAAALGLGAMSLVLGPVVTTVTLTIALWLYVPWHPPLSANRIDGAAIITYVRGLVAFNTVNYWARNADNLLLGRVVSERSLGLYTRAYQLMTAPLFQISTVMGRVLFPALTRHRHLPTQVGLRWLHATKLVIAAVAPITLTLATAAPALVATLYGPRWRGASILIELLGCAGLAQLLPSATGSAYQALGQTDELFRRGLVQSGLTVASIAIGLPWGAVGVATGILVRSWLTFWYPVLGVAHHTQLPMRRILASLIGLMIACSAFALASLALRITFASVLDPPILLLIQGFSGTCAMFLTLALVDRELFRDVRHYCVIAAESIMLTIIRKGHARA